MSKEKKINNKTREYLHGGIMVLILILSVFMLDLPLPKAGFIITLAIVIPVVIFLHEVFPHKNKGGRKREYLASIILFIVFSLIIFIFDLPNKVFAFIGILAVSDVVLYEVLNIKNNEIKT